MEVKSNNDEMRINALELKSNSDNSKIEGLSNEIEEVKKKQKAAIDDLNTKIAKLELKSQNDDKRIATVTNQIKDLKQKGGNNDQKAKPNETTPSEPVRKSKTYQCYFCDKKVFTTNGVYRHTMDVHKELVETQRPKISSSE